MEWIKLDIAAGIATLGLVKFSRAKTTPKPEFCIPTSMEIVLATFQFLKVIRLITKPRTKPSRCSPNKAKISNKPVKGFQNKEVTADSLQKSTQASFGTIQQSMSDHDFSLNELAKRVDKAINRVDSISEFLIDAGRYQRNHRDCLIWVLVLW